MCDSAWSDPVRLMRREIQELTTLQRRFFSSAWLFSVRGLVSRRHVDLQCQGHSTDGVTVCTH